MSSRGFVLTEGMIKDHTERLKRWFDLLNEIMPEHFFNAFSAEQIHKIMPALFNIEHQEGVQEITSANSVILIYLKSENINMAATAKMMKGYDIVSASIHESTQPIVIDGTPRKLVIEYYIVDKMPIKMEPAYKLGDIKKAYKSLYKTTPAELDEIFSRVNWEAVTDLSVDRVAQRLHYALMAQASDWINLDIEKAGKEELRLTMALSNCPSRGFYFKIAECLTRYGFDITRRYSRNITFQENKSDFYRMPVTINTSYIKAPKTAKQSAHLDELMWELPHIKWVPMDDLFHTELVRKKGWNLSTANLIRAASEFIHSQFSYIDRNAYNNNDIARFAVLYNHILEDFVSIFEKSFRPGEKDRGAARERIVKKVAGVINSINTGVQEKDILLKNIFKGMLNFFLNIRKTNFYVKDKSSLAFRMDPAFMDYYDEISPAYLNSFPKMKPFGIFYFFNANTIGFQMRFANIARGGWRTVIPKNVGHELEKMDFYGFTKDEIFREVYVLAHTQHMKNKDIYEGGSKMICLLKQEGPYDPANLYESQRSICRAFVDLINYDKSGKLARKEIVDALGQKEIIEIGPDENMHDVMINWMGDYAEKIGYTLGGGLISGKPETGFNHKDYGVTSLGVHQYLIRTLKELGINPAKDQFSVKIAGGPFGDVAGNEMKLLLQKENGKFIYPSLRIVAITDGPAATYDPDGLDRDEILSLVKAKNLDAFNPEKLKGEGAYIIYSEAVTDNEGNEKHTQIIRRKGKLVKELITRDLFMKTFQSNVIEHYADVFIPCGGRPSTINESNWEDYFPGGKATSKAIVEGANSFITPGARNHIQDKGVWIVKDASANKCGVITSSYEIISGLILGKEDFLKLKKQLANEVLEILVERAQKEAEWLFFQFRKTGKKLTDLTESLSVQINDKNVEISAYLDKHPELIKRDIILSHLPKTFKSIDKSRIENLPEDYKKAIVAVELACRIVYKRSQDIETEITNALKLQ